MATTSGSVGQLAGLGSRIGAWLIDATLVGLVLMVIFIPLFVIVGLIADGVMGTILYLLVQLLLGLVFTGYFIVMEGVYGYTVGKKLLSIRVVSEDGGAISMGESAIRNLLRFIDILPTAYILGMALIAMNDDEQRVGDMAASTYVVKG
ncbi:RDD family protein [Haloarcula salinisoli]|uniref:RDD family protein n=1 Tax=Haloarcula salinisoli TaxID=2487746 RepID=A0A8J7YBV4_9EURY|nr:RDD family protein [Halomicroarcula salinisoli]MBX0285936.1 RDD family protein [Halomicroarcula salinisoli]MBX0302572.1 RDD family protein [Halomicroarcula salinisoli]